MPRYYAIQFKADRNDNWHYICSESPEAAPNWKSSVIPDLYRTYADAKRRAGGFDRRPEKGYRIVPYDKQDKIDKVLNVVAPVVAAYIARGASAIVGLGIGSIVVTPFWATETLINKTLGLDREKCPNCGKKRVCQ
jgi:hypothetical protein